MRTCGACATIETSGIVKSTATTTAAGDNRRTLMPPWRGARWTRGSRVRRGTVPRGARALFQGKLTHGGECGSGISGRGNVIEADDRYVIGDRNTSFHKSAQRAHGGMVVAGKDGIGRLRQIEQPVHPFITIAMRTPCYGLGRSYHERSVAG